MSTKVKCLNACWIQKMNMMKSGQAQHIHVTSLSIFWVLVALKA